MVLEAAVDHMTTGQSPASHLDVVGIKRFLIFGTL